MAQRHYSEEDRAAALAALKANGGNLDRTASQVGVPRNTLRRWSQNPDRAAPAALRQEKVESLSTLFEKCTRDYLGQATDPKVVKATRGKDAVIAAATALDKLRLLNGEDDSTAPKEIVIRVFAPGLSMSNLHGGRDARPSLPAGPS
jgi:transposase-like protein